MSKPLSRDQDTRPGLAALSLRLDAKRAALFAVLVIDVLVAFVILQQVIAHSDYPFDSDEGAHANYGLELALDLRAGNFGAFLNDSYRQDFYPPAFSWLQAVAFLIFGISPLVARVCSLVCLLVTAPVLYAIGLELDEKLGWLIGLIAAVLTLTAQTIMVYAGLAMIETLGLLVSFTTLWLYLRAMKQPSARRLALTSVLMALTMLTKYPYGLIVAATLIVTEFLAALPARDLLHRLRMIGRRWFWLFGPWLLLMLIWFGGPGKVEGFIRYANAQPQQLELWSVENLIFYPRSIVFHYVPSPIFAVLTLAGVLWAITRRRDPQLRLFLIYLAIGLALVTVKLQDQSRFFATVAPAVHVLSAAMLAVWIARWRKGWAQARRWMIVTTTAIAICIIGSIPMLIERFAAFPALMQVEHETDPRANDLMAWVETQTARDKPFLLINPWDQLNASAVEWYRATHSTRPLTSFADIALPSGNLWDPAAQGAAGLLNRIRETRVGYLVALQGGREGHQVWPEYAQALNEVLVPVAEREFVIDLYDMARWLKRHIVTRAELEHAKAVRYHQLNITVSVYRVVNP